MSESPVIYAVSSISTVKMEGKQTYVHPRDFENLKEARNNDEEFKKVWDGILVRLDGGKPWNARLEGLCTTLEDAIRLTEKNYTDMNEAGWNQYVVIEKIPVEWYPDSTGIGTRWFFEWKQDGKMAGEGKYVIMDKPPAELKDEENVGCYAFG